EGGAEEHHLSDRNGLAERTYQRLHHGEHDRRGELEQNSLEDVHLQFFAAARTGPNKNRQSLLSTPLARSEARRCGWGLRLTSARAPWASPAASGLRSAAAT